MAMQQEEISVEELNAFVDGELGEGRRREIAARIAAEPALAARVARLQADKDRLIDLYGPLIKQPVPRALLNRAVSTASPRRMVLWNWIAAATAAAAAIVVAVWIGYAQLAGVGNDPLISQALAARNGALPAESQVAAASVVSASARDRIVAESLAVAVKVPDLRKAGYDLATITVYSDAPQRHSLQLSYRDGQGRLFTVYLTRGGGAEGFDLLTQGAQRICIWRTEELNAVMVGEMSANEMLRVASLTYADLNF
jgi:anti-sigma factor RsiW